LLPWGGDRPAGHPVKEEGRRVETRGCCLGLIGGRPRIDPATCGGGGRVSHLILTTRDEIVVLASNLMECSPRYLEEIGGVVVKAVILGPSAQGVISRVVAEGCANGG
ncbi:hypothetical protein BAE44_0009038, partial [Dichanthelium oligosanthes]